MSNDAAPSSLRLTLIAAASLAIVYAIHTLYDTSQNEANTKKLRRSTAVRRSNREQASHPPVIEASMASIAYPLGLIRVSSDSGLTILIILGVDRIPSSKRLGHILGITEVTADTIRSEVIRNAINIVLDACNNEVEIVDPTSSISQSRAEINARLAGNGDNPNMSLAIVLGVDLSDIHAALPEDTVETHNRVHNDGIDATAHELKKLLYAISEDRENRQAIQHRGITCEGCHDHPVRGVRWHCLNCADYDLCSLCKDNTIHPKNHVFAEIKIPIPLFAQPLSGWPSWYNPDAPFSEGHDLLPSHRRRFAQTYNWTEAEIDAFYDQFICLADRIDDAGEACISEFAFVKALGAERWKDRPRPIIIFRRMFAFYDTDEKGTITFKKFVSGISYLRGKDRFKPIRRALIGFDLRGDGLISKEDFLCLLQARFDLHRYLVEEIVDHESLHDVKIAEEYLRSYQPISSAFKGDIPNSVEHAMNGKHVDELGDSVPDAGVPIITEPGDVSDLAQGGSNIGSSDSSFPNNLSLAERKLLGLVENGLTRQESDRKVDQRLLWLVLKAAIERIIQSLFADIETQHKKHTEQAAQLALSQSWKRFCSRGLELAPSLDYAFVKTLNNRLKVLQKMPLHLSMDLLSKTLDADATSRASNGNDMRDELVNHSMLNTTNYILNMNNEPALQDRTNLLLSRSTPDPTLPQNRPNSVLSKSDQLVRSESNCDEQDAADARQSLVQLLTLMQEKIPVPGDMIAQPRVRDGQPCLTLDEIQQILEKPESQDLRVMVTSWLEWASF